jgi:glycerol-3-phosphate acyltransferase PlsY
MKIAGVLLLSYLIGSVPVGLIVGKITRGVDIRKHGSGNIGFTNAWRTLGWGPGIVVFVLDVTKGVVPVLLCKGFDLAPLLVISGGLLAILGHNFSVFLKFSGGKGVATSLGVVIGIEPAIAATALGIWCVLLAITRYVSVSSILAAAGAPALMWLSPRIYGTVIPIEYRVFALVAVMLILVRHSSNLKRLYAGTEPKIGRPAAARGGDLDERGAGAESTRQAGTADD